MQKLDCYCSTQSSPLQYDTSVAYLTFIFKNNIYIVNIKHFLGHGCLIFLICLLRQEFSSNRHTQVPKNAGWQRLFTVLIECELASQKLGRLCEAFEHISRTLFGREFQNKKCSETSHR